MAVDVAEVYRNSQQREVFVYGKHTPTTRNQLYYPFWLLLWKIDSFLNIKTEKRAPYMNSWYVSGMWNCFLKTGGRVDLILKSQNNLVKYIYSFPLQTPWFLSKIIPPTNLDPTNPSQQFLPIQLFSMSVECSTVVRFYFKYIGYCSVQLRLFIIVIEAWLLIV